MNELERKAIIDELRDWAIVNGRPLPLPAETIADYEAGGIDVNLYDGTLFDADKFLDSTVALSPEGLAMYEAKCGGRIYAAGGSIDECDNAAQRAGWMAAMGANADAETAQWLATHPQAVAA